MQINPRTPTTKNPPEQFTGDVWLDPVASPRERVTDTDYLSS